MRSVPADFLPPGRALARLSMGVSVVLFAAAVAVSVDAYTLRAKALEIERQAAERQQQMAEEQARERAPKPEPPYAADARRLAAIAAMPIDAILLSLERIRIPGVRVLSLDIQSETGRVQLEIEAHDLSQVSRYLDDLNAGFETPKWALATARNEQGAKPRAVASLESSWSARDR